MIKPGALVQFKKDVTKYYFFEGKEGWHFMDNKLGIIEKRYIEDDVVRYIVWIQDCLEKVSATIHDFDLVDYETEI